MGGGARKRERGRKRDVMTAKKREEESEEA